MSFLTNRRAMLMGMVTAATAAATGSSATGNTAPQEAPELLALADSLDSTLQAYLDATAEVERIAAQWQPQMPAFNPDIVRYHNDCKNHADIRGNPVPMPWCNVGKTSVQPQGKPEHFEASAAAHRREYARKMATKSQRGAKSEKAWAEREAALVAPARAYWSEVERVKAASGIEAAQAQATAARHALHSLAGQIMTFEESTITGLIIKAQAMQAWGQVDQFYRAFNPDGAAWADEMAATVIRQASA